MEKNMDAPLLDGSYSQRDPQFAEVGKGYLRPKVVPSKIEEEEVDLVIDCATAKKTYGEVDKTDITNIAELFK